MKYINFKRYKFSTILKNVNNTILKSIYRAISKVANLLSLTLTKINKIPKLSVFDYKKIYKIFNSIPSIILKIIKKLYSKRYKGFSLYFSGLVIFIAIAYLAAPIFYNYDKEKISKILCKDKNFKCSIKGDVNYSFYPSPRIKIKDLIIYDFFDNKKVLIESEKTNIKISLKNLQKKDNFNFKSIELNNFKINFNYENLSKYKNVFQNKISFIPVYFKKGKIILFDKKNYVASVNDANIIFKFIKNNTKASLDGKFLGDEIYLDLSSKNIEGKTFTDLLFKLKNFNLLTKANIVSFVNKKDKTSGNILFKKDKNKITAMFEYKDNQFLINKANLKNAFLDGNLIGKIKFIPYFNFDLDVNLKSINLKKLYSYFLSLDQEKQKKIFNINNKINGNLILSSDKIYSSYNLIKSFESFVRFNNGNIFVERFLINLGKLGATDILGSFNNDKKFTNFKFESNIFVDNQKKFLSKLGIANKKAISTNLFVSGNLDWENLRCSFYEISADQKLSNENVNYIEKEFNDIMFEDDYVTLFDFSVFKQFIKSIADEIN